MEVKGQLHASEVLILQRSIHRNFILDAPLVPKKKVCLKFTLHTSFAFTVFHHTRRQHSEKTIKNMDKELNRKLQRWSKFKIQRNNVFFWADSVTTGYSLASRRHFLISYRPRSHFIGTWVSKISICLNTTIFTR